MMLRAATTLLVLLVSATMAFAQSGPGLWQVAPNAQLSQCTNIGTPVTNRTWCFDGNNNPNYTIKVWDGSQYVNITGGGGGAPVDAHYVLTLPNVALPNADDLSVLPNNILVNDNVFHLVRAYSGASCLPGEVMTAISGNGTVTCTPATGNAGLGGKVQLCNTTTTAVITFSTPVPNANYPVTLGTQPDTGTPPHVVADYNTPTINGFNISISDQPGAGNCVKVSWAAGAAATGGGAVPGGSNMQVQFNDSGVFGGASELLWDKAANILRPTNPAVTTLGTRDKTFLSIYADGDHSTLKPALALLEQNGGTALTDMIANFGSEGQITQLTANAALAQAYMGLSSSNTNLVYFINQDGTYSSPSDLGTGGFLGQFRFVGFNTVYRTYADIIGRVSTDDATKGRLILQVSGIGWNFYGQGTMRLPGLTFTNLPTSGDAAANGVMTFCSDCDPTATLLTCTHVGAQTGAFAYRVNGAWKCMG